MIYCNKCGFPNNTGNVCGRCGNFLPTLNIVYPAQIPNKTTEKLIFNKIHAGFIFSQIGFYFMLTIIGLLTFFTTDIDMSGTLILALVGYFIGIILSAIYQIIMGKNLWQQKRSGAIMAIISSIFTEILLFPALAIGIYYMYAGMNAITEYNRFSTVFAFFILPPIILGMILYIIPIIYYIKKIKYFIK